MKVLTLTIGGKERTLNVGKWYFTKYLGEVLKDDPLNPSNDLSKAFNYAVAIVYAGIKTDEKVNKSSESVTLDEVTEWVGLMETEEVNELINKYNSLGEKKDQALENGA